MASNGWAKLGAALAGTSESERELIRQKTINALANTDTNVAQARMAVAKARANESLGARLADLGLDNPEALADVARSGVNLRNVTGGLGDVQKQRFRQAAVDAATGGNWGGANAQLAGVASGPVALPSVQGGMLISNRLLPGGGDVTVTPVGQGQIDANNARGQAALIRANRPAATRSGGGAGSGRLSEVNRIRLNSALKDLQPQIQMALNDIKENQGAQGGPGVRKLADAQRRLADLQAQREQILETYGEAPAVPAIGVTPRAQPVAAATPAAPVRARNPKTGEVIELRNGQWVPVK